ncbi:MAG: DUF4062 domain-containing protein [Desulfobacterales bacterium]|nr:DUF4062 domain-containing protein [Desulfobacterales bacterium]
MTTSTKPRHLYKVFISSTYLDNMERRKRVQEAVTLAGMLWHGMEIFPASIRTTVEESLRYAREADLLVGIIAWRYGWEPPDGNGKSITEMEYDAAKQRFMFQLDPSLPVNIKDFDQGPDKWDKQKKLDAFKQRFSEDQSPAHFTKETLQAKVLDTLNRWRQEQEQGGGAETDSNTASDPASTPPTDPKLKNEIKAYCKKVDHLHSTVPVAGFVTQLRVNIDIEDIFVPLRAMLDLRGVDDEKFSNAKHAETYLKQCDKGLEISLLEAFRQSEQRNQKGLVILGDPGSGKTTHLKRFLLYCLREGPEKLHLPSGMLPVFLPLRELKDLDKGLDAFIQDQLTTIHLKTPDNFGKRLLERGNLLFLLDGRTK